LLREQLMPSVVNAFAFMMYLVVVPIFTFLMLLNKHSLQQAVRTYVLPHNQILIGELWPKLNAQIEGYIRGKLIHVLVITVANTLAFRILGLNYSFLLGFGVGLSVIIPYVGAVLIGVPVVLVALLQFGLTYELLLVLGVYLIIQVLDGNVLTPLLFSKVLNLDAFTILAAVLIFGGLWGFWGVFFAIPLATLIKTLIMNWPSQGEAKPS
ncbi:MAG: AI-2E family transporter, partial [Succinivibrionaceae bacterium]|nr:AI-2E family transporter [Succinivibrionaceae bacterium]